MRERIISNAQVMVILFSQVVLVLAGCALLLGEPSSFPTYYRPRLMGLTAFLYSFLIQLPVMLFRISRSAPVTIAKEKLRVRKQLQVALSIGFLLGGLGSLGLWGSYIMSVPYDTFVHFIFSALVMVSGVYFLRVWYDWSLKKTVVLLALIIGVSGVVWECIEFLSDRWLHFGHFGRLFDRESLSDVIANIFGVWVGAGIIAWRKRLY